MNEYGIRTTKEEKLLFPYSDYPLIDFEGTYTVTLMDKSWPLDYSGHYLICAFRSDDNIRFRFCVWRKPHIEYYMPDNTPIDFSKVLPGTRWKCTFTHSRNNNIRWRTAEPIED